MQNRLKNFMDNCIGYTVAKDFSENQKNRVLDAINDASMIAFAPIRLKVSLALRDFGISVNFVKNLQKVKEPILL
jgi:hypothetical protein